MIELVALVIGAYVAAMLVGALLAVVAALVRVAVMIGMAALAIYGAWCGLEFLLPGWGLYIMGSIVLTSLVAR